MNLEITESDNRRQEIIYELEDNGELDGATLRAGLAGKESTLGADLKQQTYSILDDFRSSAE